MEQITITGKGPKMLKLSDDRFVGVSKPVTLDQFERGGTYRVEIEKNGRFENITKVEVVAKAPTPEPAKEQHKPETRSSGRDFDAEAKGKTRCVSFQAALQSPVVANLCMTVNGVEKALEIVRQAADACYAYTFEERK